MVVELQDVSQRFARRWALLHVTLQIPAAATVLLTGENGAGKTTLLRVMATALRPSRGQVRLFDRVAHLEAEFVRPRLALMTHQNYLYDPLSARENLHLAARLSGRSDARLAALLDQVNLSRHGELPVASFSAGMKRRLVLARMLLLEPDLVLLDEPFGQLDPEGVSLMEQTITAWRHAGKTLVISTHDIERGRALCTTQLHLTDGMAAALQPLQPL